MKKFILSLVLALSLATGFAQQSESSPDIYGWIRYEKEQKSDYGICKFNAATPDKISVLFPFDKETIQACAGAFANGKYYVYRNTPGTPTTPLDFGTIDLNTGAYTKIADYGGMNTLFSDMTFDYSTQTMYAIGNPNGSSTTYLFAVDLTNGDIKNQINLGEIFCTLACSYDGQLYAIKGDDGHLYKIDKATGNKTDIGYTWEEPQYEYKQTMEFDHNTNKLYWAGNNIYEEGFLAIINTTTGESERTGSLYNDAQIVGMYIPFEKIDAGAPSAVKELTVAPASDGSMSATLSWTNPATTYSNAELTGITRVDIYRDEVLTGTVDSATPGQQSTWTDETLTGDGRLITYKVVPVNEKGNGESAKQTVFVGHDVPLAPTEITATAASASSVAIAWKEPDKGIHGGWIDKTTLKYKITRLPDNKIVAETATGQSFTDSDITALNNYSYRIESSTADGIGGNSVSNPVKVGPAISVPYSCNFATDEQFALWTVVDANKDTFTWRRETTLNAAYYYYNEDGETGGDDYLISSPISLKAGLSYRLRFKLQSYDVGYPEKMTVYFGQGETKEAMVTQLGDYTIEDNNFKQFEVMLPAITSDGNYNIGFYCHSDPNMFILYLTDVVIEEVTSGSVKGTVTDTDNNPLQGVTVSVKTTGLTATTGEDGKYSFAEIEPGNYTLSFNRDGYATSETEISVEAGTTVNADAKLVKLKELSVSGTIMSEEGKPVAGASVTVDGYTSASAVTASDGKFSIAGVMAAESAKLLVSRYELQPYSKELDLSSSEISLGEITMTDKLLTPYMVKVESTDSEARISWQKPLDLSEYRHDSGEHDGRIGKNGDTSKSVYGSVFRTPARLTGMSWYTENFLQTHPAVNVFVFDLNENGEPTSTVLYSKEGVTNSDNEWNSFDFPSPIDAPRGYMIAISCEGHAGLGLAKATEEYPFAERENCYSDDYTTGIFTYTEAHDIVRPMMIRAKGINLADKDLPEVSSKKYNVWRMKDSDKDNTDAWEKVTSEPVESLEYTDSQWQNAEQGIYRYAVTTVYHDQATSEAAFSGTVANKMLTDVTVAVKTNTPENQASGSIVTLTNMEDATLVYTATAGNDGTAKIDDVWKGKYSIEIVKHGFVKTSAADIDLSSAQTYTLNYELTEYVVDPFNLEVSKTGTDFQREFAWNTANFLSDDFEGHDDFAVNSTGKIGWTYIDGDDAPTMLPFEDVKFANAGSKMAFMVFNPFETDPVLGVVNQGIRAHSGNKFLTDFPADDAGIYNNDFIISPALNFKKDFTFKFYAKSFSEDYGKEKINVGYSLTDNGAGSFTWLNGDTPIELPQGDWKEYSYTVPADAKYVAINCVSDYLLMVMIDDIFIGMELPDGVDIDAIRNDLSFQIYLDGEYVASTAEKKFTFTNLAKGTHRAGVKAVFASTTTKLVETEFTVDETTGGVETIANGNHIVYPNPTKGKLTVKGDYDYAEIFNISGISTGKFQKDDNIDISGNPEGVYFIKVVSGDTSSTYRIILTR